MRLRGLNPLIAAISTPTCAPLVAGTRLRGGTANSARGAASFVAEAITTARAAGATGLLMVRMDSAFYNAATIAACRRGGARFSVTARMDPKIRQARSRQIPEHAWTRIRYPKAIFDDDEQRWISDAEVAAVDYTAFASRRKQRGDRGLIVRRVRRLAPEARPGRPSSRPAWRSPRRLHRQPVRRPCWPRPTTATTRSSNNSTPSSIDGPLAHLPSGDFAANAAWLTCAGIAHNLLHAAATLASRYHGTARSGTLRRS